jgi:hypothetical protein
MQQIASSRYSQWISSAFTKAVNNIGQVILMGVIAIVLVLTANCLASCFNPTLSGMLGRVGEGLGMLFSQIVSSLVGGVVAAGLINVGFALHQGREPSMEDFFLKPDVMVQAALVTVLTQGISVVALIILALPSAGLFYASITTENPLLGFLAVLLAIPAIIALFPLQALFVFAMPLVIDKKYDFWSAITTSADCVRRDLLGLTLFVFILGLLTGLGTLLTCVIGVVFFMPLYTLVIVHAYRDYFGMESVPPADMNPLHAVVPEMHDGTNAAYALPAPTRGVPRSVSELPPPPPRQPE